jgi:DNA-cytosine methyltransferase
MKHGSLFSGIGGFDLASEWMGWENVFHCEWMEFPRKVLDYYWPNADSHIDICKTDFKKYEGTIDIISGGFPCQPFSLAGKRKGTDDERYLWGEMLRAIQEIKPKFVIAENVFGITNIDGGLVFEQVCLDLEAEGYEVQPFIIPAAAKNAPHRRDRCWFIATPTAMIDEAPIAKVDARNQKQMEKGNSPFILGLGQQAMRGMLPTPTAMDSSNATATMKSTQVKEGSMHSVTLTRALSMGILPTPNARDWKDTIGNGKDAPSIGVTRGYSLGQKLNSLLPTPTIADSKHSTHKTPSWDSRVQQKHLAETLLNPYIQEPTGKTSQLNPRFVAEMMGFPPNWTELPFLNGGQNPLKVTETP